MLAHSARDRSAFAHGALTAARWIPGRRGCLRCADVLGLNGRARGGWVVGIGRGGPVGRVGQGGRGGRVGGGV